MGNSEINLNHPKILEVLQNVLKYISIGIFVYCLIGLGKSIKHNYPLWANPMYAEGTIVDFREVTWVTMTDGSSICVFHGHSATQSTHIRPPIPLAFGH